MNFHITGLPAKASGMIVTAGLLDGRELVSVAERLLADRHVAYPHARCAAFDCCAAPIGRAWRCTVNHVLPYVTTHPARGAKYREA